MRGTSGARRECGFAAIDKVVHYLSSSALQIGKFEEILQSLGLPQDDSE
jgi:hypothetical protein